MKKTYIIPELTAVYTAQTLLQTGSPTLTKQGDNYTGTLTNQTAGGAGLVKEDNSYDVWDDDWSR